VRRLLAEDEFDSLVCRRCLGVAAREQDRLIGGKGRFGVVRVCGDGLGEFGAGARHTSDEAERQNYLDALAAAWTERDADEVVRGAASHLREHDDREQFMAGIDIFLKGIT
jgi:hypothetical protein